MDRIDWIHLFTSFNGRISRQPFWIGVAILAAAEIATQWLANRIQGDPLSTILDLAFTYPEFALSVKRANDRDMSPWVLGLFFAINVALDLFTLLNGPIDTDRETNRLILIPFAVLALVLIVELGFRRGTEGPNRYGPDPLGQAPT
jgi:uncharacterized membrane protein YhaH (DUF805 family)